MRLHIWSPGMAVWGYLRRKIATRQSLRIRYAIPNIHMALRRSPAVLYNIDDVVSGNHWEILGQGYCSKTFLADFVQVDV